MGAQECAFKQASSVHSGRHVLVAWHHTNVSIAIPNVCLCVSASSPLVCRPHRLSVLSSSPCFSVPSINPVSLTTPHRQRCVRCMHAHYFESLQHQITSGARTHRIQRQMLCRCVPMVQQLAHMAACPQACHKYRPAEVKCAYRRISIKDMKSIFTQARRHWIDQI